ncbi:hypothetical protein Nos7524_4251 [Nostoc sp. PCC 7524]|uniref:DUF4079 domain-containing protein n=1 Tax=Nostoc sp. (strain ATCC 29411 / PCC 7524) TaxID=28072 RepID=UPI00029ECEA8|nr:DUF4079 domain-containing protein [Nostoc sp. PCC 7524]AFY50011.1 hypothetical protein Nos7524_4251 [Nostoc sp. PCC 7524]
MHLPSFLWLWKIAAWSMGLSILAYLLLAVTGVWMWRVRNDRDVTNFEQFRSSAQWATPHLFCGSLRVWRSLHYIIGISMVSLVLLLLAIGIVGTLGHFGSLGHSPHLAAGLTVVVLVLVSAASATQIGARRPWARPLHISVNMILFLGFTWVSLTGWSVVQKYLP